MIKLSNDVNVLIDIKSKLSHKSSNPKAFNIDKTLKLLATGDSIFCFLILIIDLSNQSIKCGLVPILADTFIQMLYTRYHWAGRNSLGATQLSGDLHLLIDKSSCNKITENKAKIFLEELLSIEQITQSI